MERAGGGLGGGPRYYSRQRPISVSEVAQRRRRRRGEGITSMVEMSGPGFRLVSEICCETSLDHKSQIHQSCQNKSRVLDICSSDWMDT